MVIQGNSIMDTPQVNPKYPKQNIVQLSTSFIAYPTGLTTTYTPSDGMRVHKHFGSISGSNKLTGKQ